MEKRKNVLAWNRTIIPRASRVSPNDYNDWATQFHDNYVLTIRIGIFFPPINFKLLEKWTFFGNQFGAHRRYKIRTDCWIWSLLYTIVSRRVCKNCERRILATSCLSVSPSTWKQLDPHWTDFHKTWYLNIFRKSSEKIQDSQKYHKNNEQFSGRQLYIFWITPRSILLIVRNVSEKAVEEIKTLTYFSIDNVHLMYNAHPKLFDIPFDV